MMILGPFLIRKIGLEEYAVLSLAIYFYNLALGYSDFAAYTHLLVSFSRSAPERRIDTSTATLLRTAILGLFFCVLLVFGIYLPRHDALYPLLAIFMLGIPISPINFEWYFIAKKEYASLFGIRMLALGVLGGLLIVWFTTNLRPSPLFFPIAGLVSAAASAVLAVRLLGLHRTSEWLTAFKAVSVRRLVSLFLKLSPMASTLLTAPYFLAFALPWYSMACADKKLVGAFSISYRLVMGMSSLMAPLVFYLIPRGNDTTHRPSLGKTVLMSLLITVGLWFLGLPILWGYFHFSEANPALLPHSFSAYSVLMVGFFFLSLRTPYVGHWLVSRRYGLYFFGHFFSCLPVLLLSTLASGRIPPYWVVWLACLPDALASTFFISFDVLRSGSDKRGKWSRFLPWFSNRPYFGTKYSGSDQ